MSTRTALVSKTYIVTVTGQPHATVDLTIDGHQWKTVQLTGSGTRTVQTTSLDLLGLLGDLAKTLGAGDFEASYA